MSEKDQAGDKQAKADARNELKDLKKAVESAGVSLSGKAQPKGKPGPIGKTVSPDVGMATRFKPGHDRPGPGRTRKTPMADALRKRLGMKLPPKYAKPLGLPKGITWAEAVAWTALYDTLKTPSHDKFKGYAAHADGPLVQEISGPGGAPIPLDVDDSAARDAHEQLRTITARLRDRVTKTAQP